MVECVHPTPYKDTMQRAGNQSSNPTPDIAADLNLLQLDTELMNATSANMSYPLERCVSECPAGKVPVGGKISTESWKGHLHECIGVIIITQ